MQKLITVIIPIYNVQIYLRKCIDTVINQTYKNLEIILVDDGSPDDCGKICDEYAQKDSRIKVIHKKNGGLSSARNAGLNICKGEYITFIDSDDYVDEKYVEILNDILEKNNVDIAIANRYIMNNDIIEKDVWHAITKKKMNSKELLTEFFSDKIPHEAWGKLYRRELFEDSRYEYGLKIFEDLKFIYNLLLNKNLEIYCDTTKYLYYYRHRNDSLMKSNYDKHWKYELNFYDEVFWKLEKEQQKQLLDLYTQICLRNYYKIINDVSLTNKQLTSEITELKRHLKTIKSHAYKIKGKRNKIILFLIRHMKIVLIMYRKLKNVKIHKFSKAFNEYCENQRTDNKKLYLIFNGPTTGNLGDHAILFGEEKVLEDRKIKYFRISAKEMIYFFNLKLFNEVSKDDYIFITGGGNIGTLWRNEQQRINKVLDEFKQNKIIVFPQTVYYHDNEFGKMCLELDKKFYYACKDLTIYSRDMKTYKFVKEILNVKTELVKDMALNLDYKKSSLKRKGIIICLRNDKEKNINAKQIEQLIKEIKERYPNDNIRFIDTVITDKEQYTYKEGKREFLKMIRLFQKSKIVVTDRLHGMILSVITDTPCIAVNNTSGKVKGVYDTIKDDKVNVDFREL